MRCAVHFAIARITFSITNRYGIMKRMLLYYGGIGAAIMIGVNLLVLLVTGIPDAEDFAMGEIVGYTTIVAALAIPIYLGVREYRDKMSGGGISFGKAWLVGIVVTELPAVAFAAYNLLYVKVIDPDFTQKYMDYQTELARTSMTAEEFQAFEATMGAQSPLLTNIAFQTLVMYVTVLLIGIGLSLLLAIFLRRKAQAAVQS